MKTSKLLTALMLATCFHASAPAACGRTLVVNQRAPAAADTNDGGEDSPLKTIQAGADRAMPGDTVLVKGGIYREWVVPPRGGTREKPIRYLAAPGEEVSIRGSERITSWVHEGGTVWMVELDNAFFGTFNPFQETLSGSWLYYGGDHHLGDVYLNGAVYHEKMSPEEVAAEPGTWHATADATTTRIRANFGPANPNEELAEIHARECVIFPATKGLKHIIIDGFDIRHAASNWAPPDIFQKGAVGPHFGYGWIIRNCTISDVKNVGICLGATEEHHWDNRSLPAIDSFGHHLVRDNIIRRCGQAGIAGAYGCVRSVIEGNLIEDIAWREQYGGAEIGGIKLHFPIDAIIRGNHIRRVRTTRGGPAGIWLDWGAQNTRVSGNLVYDCDAHPLKLEVNHGPVLVDHNVFSGSEIRVWSDGTIFAHNLFYHTSVVHKASQREVPWYQPHSTVEAGRGNIQLRDEQWHNNLFIAGSGLQHAPPARPGFIIAHNLYLDGARPHPVLDKRSITGSAPSHTRLRPEPANVVIGFHLDELVFDPAHPRLSSAVIGRLPVPNMTIETPDGQPLHIAADYFGKEIPAARIAPGPFQGIQAGANRFRLWPK
jgi:alpha-N-arabinofuranosidase